MSENSICKREGCGHPISLHNMRRAEKRAKKQGGVALVSDFPSGQQESINYHSGKNDEDACSEPDCDCIMYVSAS